MNRIVSFLGQSNRYKHLVGDTGERHNTGIKAKRDGKPVQKEKKLETTAKSVDLTDAFRPKRSSTPGGTVVRFHRNATKLRAKRIGEIKQIFCQNKQKFCRVNIFFITAVH